MQQGAFEVVEVALGQRSVALAVRLDEVFEVDDRRLPNAMRVGLVIGDDEQLQSEALLSLHLAQLFLGSVDGGGVEGAREDLGELGAYRHNCYI